MKVCPCHLAVTSCAYTRDPRHAEAAYGPCRPSLAPALETRRQGERPPGAEPSLHSLATPAAHGHPRETLSSHSFQHDPSMKGAKEERARWAGGGGQALRARPVDRTKRCLSCWVCGSVTVTADRTGSRTPGTAVATSQGHGGALGRGPSRMATPGAPSSARRATRWPVIVS